MHYHNGYFYLFYNEGSCCDGTASTYTMSGVGMASSGQHDGHLPSRCRARSCGPIASCTAGMPLPIISPDSAARAARHIR